MTLPIGGASGPQAAGPAAPARQLDPAELRSPWFQLPMPTPELAAWLRGVGQDARAVRSGFDLPALDPPDRTWTVPRDGTDLVAAARETGVPLDALLDANEFAEKDWQTVEGRRVLRLPAGRALRLPQAGREPTGAYRGRAEDLRRDAADLYRNELALQRSRQPVEPTGALMADRGRAGGGGQAVDTVARLSRLADDMARKRPDLDGLFQDPEIARRLAEEQDDTGRAVQDHVPYGVISFRNEKGEVETLALEADDFRRVKVITGDDRIAVRSPISQKPGLMTDVEVDGRWYSLLGPEQGGTWDQVPWDQVPEPLRQHLQEIRSRPGSRLVAELKLLTQGGPGAPDAEGRFQGERVDLGDPAQARAYRARVQGFLQKHGAELDRLPDPRVKRLLQDLDRQLEPGRLEIPWPGEARRDAKGLVDETVEQMKRLDLAPSWMDSIRQSTSFEFKKDMGAAALHHPAFNRIRLDEGLRGKSFDDLVRRNPVALGEIYHELWHAYYDQVVEEDAKFQDSHGFTVARKGHETYVDIPSGERVTVADEAIGNYIQDVAATGAELLHLQRTYGSDPSRYPPDFRKLYEQKVQAYNRLTTGQPPPVRGYYHELLSGEKHDTEKPIPEEFRQYILDRVLEGKFPRDGREFLKKDLDKVR